MRQIRSSYHVVRFFHELPSLTFVIIFMLSGLTLSLKAESGMLLGVPNDVNGDSLINILILGTNSSIAGSEEFSPNAISMELQNILAGDESITLEVNVVFEDIHKSKAVTVGLGGAGDEYNWVHHSHSLVQYYYWPENQESRWQNLKGEGEYRWDYVIIASDPHIISSMPGYYSLGVNKIVSKLMEGEAIPLLLMMWPKDEMSPATVDHFEEFTYRAADGATTPLEVVPAGLAWEALPEDKKDIANTHPTPNGAYVCASSIYAHLFSKSAASSQYNYDDEIADIALATVIEEVNTIHYSGVRSFVSPFKSCDIGDLTINYNHTGTSSENGIKNGMNWVFNQSPKTLQNGGDSPIDFNFGRANSNFEANKRYKIDPSLFDYSFGFPMQDHSNHGNESMLYGIDRRASGTMNDTDLGVSRFMIDQNEIPYARAVPIRTLFAQMHEAIPGQSAYSDSWHMHNDLNKAIGAYMFTLLNGTCVLPEEPSDPDTDAWRTWMSHKIGFETAWNLMYLQADVPNCDSLFDADGDGFNSEVDCNDMNQQINPNQEEEAYNGIDDDCNPATLDDDLDQDGFVLEEDCDDTHPDINPSAEEIPNNDIDEDCDGYDLVTSTLDLRNIKFTVYPNPSADIIHIDAVGNLDFKATIYDLKGSSIISARNVNIIDLSMISPGNYILELEDLKSGHLILEHLVISQ